MPSYIVGTEVYAPFSTQHTVLIICTANDIRGSLEVDTTTYPSFNMSLELAATPLYIFQ